MARAKIDGTKTMKRGTTRRSGGYKVKKNNPYQKTIWTPDKGDSTSSVRKKIVYGNYPDSKPFKDSTLVIRERRKKKK